MFTEEGRKAYPEIASAYDAVRKAEEQLRDAMATRFPRGCRVFVLYHNGSHFGTVERTDEYRVYVRNEKTGKVTGRYPLIDQDGLVSVRISY
ncbi:hypothetical protein [Pseudomonas indica]|uniref:hypothetical protein n=1 Tax=Pseudomonas indica TaxID=137658 RepID=UPI003FD33B52